MDVNFKHTPAPDTEPVRFEQIFAEKPGGGLVGNPPTDLPPTTPVVWDSTNEKYRPLTSSDADAKVAPEFVTGDWVYAGEGDQLVRLINGANLRKETAVITAAQAALIPTINLV